MLDDRGLPVPDAEIRLVGVGRFTSDRDGVAQVVVPDAGWYALVVRYPGHEQVLYMEELKPDMSYVYRADSLAAAASRASGEIGTLGNVLTAGVMARRGPLERT